MAKRELGPQTSIRFLPNEIKGLRDRDGLTQEGLASKAGISIETARRAERGIPVLLDNAQAIGAALDVDYKSISASTRTVIFGKYSISEDQTDELLFYFLGLIRTTLTVIEEILNGRQKS